jgi:hypothetical protein
MEVQELFLVRCEVADGHRLLGFGISLAQAIYGVSGLT